MEPCLSVDSLAHLPYFDFCARVEVVRYLAWGGIGIGLLPLKTNSEPRVLVFCRAISIYLGLRLLQGRLELFKLFLPLVSLLSELQFRPRIPVAVQTLLSFNRAHDCVHFRPADCLRVASIPLG